MIFNQHIDKSQPNWMKTYIETNEVQDEIQYLDLGFEEERGFFQYTIESLGLSYVDQFPHNYKFAGFSIMRNLDAVQYDRSTYDLLACIGDIGGLEAIILLIGGLFIKQIANFFATVYLMPHIFYYRPECEAEDVV